MRQTKTIRMFGGLYKIQKIEGTDYWDFVDFPEIAHADPAATVDMKNNTLRTALEKVQTELRKSFKIGKCFIPTKEQYERFFPAESDRIKFSDDKPAPYWTSSEKDAAKHLSYAIDRKGTIDAELDSCELGIAPAFEILDERPDAEWLDQYYREMHRLPRVKEAISRMLADGYYAKISRVSDDLNIKESYTMYMSETQLKQILSFLKDAEKLGYTGEVSFIIGSNQNTTVMTACKESSDREYVKKEIFRSSPRWLADCIDDSKWISTAKELKSLLK